MFLLTNHVVVIIKYIIQRVHTAPWSIHLDARSQRCTVVLEGIFNRKYKTIIMIREVFQLPSVFLIIDNHFENSCITNATKCIESKRHSSRLSRFTFCQKLKSRCFIIFSRDKHSVGRQSLKRVFTKGIWPIVRIIIGSSCLQQRSLKCA